MTNYDLSAPEGLAVAGVRASYLEYLHACPICRGTSLGHYCRVPSLFREGEFIRYERCSRCGTAFRNPRLPSDYRESRYEEGPAPESATRLRPENQIHYQYMMRLICKLLGRTSGEGLRLLDFGCGAGGFLLEARARGFDVMGLELSEVLASHVEDNLGIPTFQGLIGDPLFADEMFHVIISSQVFEHLVDPRGTLLQLRDHLVSPGVLLIEVPNLHHVREKLRRGASMDDSHLFYFSARSLSKMLRMNGFRVVRVQQGLRLYRVLTRLTSRSPDWIQDIGQRIFSALQVKTGLSIVAMLER